MKQKYLQFYSWYNSEQRKKVKYAIAFCVLGFSYFLYFSIYTALFSLAIPGSDSRSFWIIEKISDISFQLLIDLYRAAPYLMIGFLFVILMLYKNIFLKIAMALICLMSLLFQFGVIMGFTSYLDFFYFLPQVILIIAVFFATIRAQKWRS